MSVVVAGSARIRSDAREAAITAAASMRADTLAEPGCVEYRFSFALDDADVVLLFEHWADAASLDAHMATPHMERFGLALAAILDGPVEFTRYEVAEHRPLFDTTAPGPDDVAAAAETARTAAGPSGSTAAER